MVARQTASRSGPANKEKIVSVFDQVDLRNFPVGIDTIRYSIDSNNINNATIDSLNQIEDLENFLESKLKNHY